jgi:hypothetical protein
LLEYFTNPPDEALAIRGTEANEQDATMRSWSKSSNVGEIQVLCDQESRIPLRCFPDFTVTATTQVLFSNRMNIVVETR